MKRYARLAIAGAVATALVASGCSSNNGDEGGGSDHKQASVDIIGNAKDSKGPADKVKGAKEGGEIHYLGDADLSHLDPARNYVSGSLMVGQKMLYRSLTNYREDGKGGQKLVGDLATSPGKDVNGDCTKWEYELKDGLKYDDGSEIKAEDVAYGVSRSMAKDDKDNLVYPEGPQFLQNWLDPDGKYKGPYDGEKTAPGVSVDGNKLTFTFKDPRCETPFATAMPTTAPIPKDKDSKEDMDNDPVSSGPYKIKKRTKGEKMTVVRNKHWDPKTDPIRNAYPDSFKFTWNQDAEEITKRIAENASGDENLATMENVPATELPEIMEKKGDYGDRLINEPQKYTSYLAINNERVDDKKVRQALNYAFPREAWVRTLGGKDALRESSTLLGPTVPGYKDYDAYPTNKKKAKELIGDKKIKLKFGYRNDGSWPKVAAMLKDEYAKVGVEIDTVEIQPDDYYDQIADPDANLDLYWNSWGQDWPSGSTVIPPLFNSKSIKAETNYARLDDGKLDKKMSKLEVDSDGFKKIAPKWAELGEDIMKDQAPVIPTDYQVGTWISGSNVGGLYMNMDVNNIDPSKMYNKKP